MSNYIVVKPFSTKGLNAQTAVREHYDAGHDFIILSLVHGEGRHISKRDVEKDPAIKLEVRYGRDGSKVMILP